MFRLFFVGKDGIALAVVIWLSYPFWLFDFGDGGDQEKIC